MGYVMSDEEDSRRKRQKKRSVAIALALFAIAVLFFVVTIIRLGGNVLNRPL